MSLDLHSRISMINKMNGYDTPEPVAPTQQEIEAEEALVVATEEAQVSEGVISTEYPEGSVKELDKTDLILEAVNELKAEIVKMNKHINSIQKFIKKNS